MSKKIKVRCFFGINRDNNTNESVLEINDDQTGKRILEIKFTPLQLTQLLGRMGAVEGGGTLYTDQQDLDSYGKRRIVETIVVEIPDYFSNDCWEEVAVEKARKQLDPQYTWEVSSYFGSKDSTFTKDGKRFANVKCVRYE